MFSDSADSIENHPSTMSSFSFGSWQGPDGQLPASQYRQSQNHWHSGDTIIMKARYSYCPINSSLNIVLYTGWRFKYYNAGSCQKFGEAIRIFSWSLCNMWLDWWQATLRRDHSKPSVIPSFRGRATGCHWLDIQESLVYIFLIFQHKLTSST